MDQYKHKGSFTSKEEAIKIANAKLLTILDNKMVDSTILHNLQEEFAKLEKENSVDTLNKIEQNIDLVENSLSKADLVVSDLNAIKASFVEEFTKWTAITGCFEVYGKNLSNIMKCKKNINKLRHDATVYITIKEQIQDLEELFANKHEIHTVYKKIVYFSSLRDNLINKLKQSSKVKEVEITADHLLVIATFEKRFFNRFWSYFDDLIEIGEKEPAFLVKIMRLVDEDADYRANLKEVFEGVTVFF